MGREVVIGVISDTHGLLRPEALAALAGSYVIIHAGDIGRQEILDELAVLAPVFTVRGNTDHGEWADGLPEREIVKVGAAKLWVQHDASGLDGDVKTAECAVVIHGHTHRPSIERRDGVLYVNPGSAGPRRFDLPVSVARLRVVGGEVEAELVDLPVGVLA